MLFRASTVTEHQGAFTVSSASVLENGTRHCIYNRCVYVRHDTNDAQLACQGLTLIAGHLLLHSPEEDAFWLFVSMMDAYLRPYFWSNPTQLEVDAALFSKALEGNDAQVFKKLMIDMSITPNKISHPW